jgi:hypothetical protein
MCGTITQAINVVGAMPQFDFGTYHTFLNTPASEVIPHACTLA